MTSNVMAALIKADAAITANDSEELKWSEARLIGLLDHEAKRNPRHEALAKAMLKRVCEARRA